jgi:diketogulonate reductase-like aldo/keto reductase
VRRSSRAGSVWVTTKLANADQGAATARRAFEASLERLGLGGVDLYLLHWPHERRLESWRVLEQVHEEGLARSIGVSNFLVRHLDELLADASVPPAVNQIELSPFLYRSREDTLRRCSQAGIVVEAYSPDQGAAGWMTPSLPPSPARSAGRRRRCSSAGRCRKGSSCFHAPRTARIAENAAVFDFSLVDAQLATLDALDEGLTTGWDPARQA